jgi:peptidoglycan/LPS O-acetylase OafA/YrhL
VFCNEAACKEIVNKFYFKSRDYLNLVICSKNELPELAEMIQSNYRLDIQVLRGLAVLAVILFHAKADIVPLGFLGVDVFFVISGFVVTPLILRIFEEQTNSSKRVTNLIRFYKRRFYRLAPALTLTLVTSAIVIFLLGPTSDHQRFSNQGIATLFLAGNIGAYHFSGDYFNSNPNPLVHTWSLSIEEQIYIFLPIVVFLIFRHKSFINHKFKALLFLITGSSMLLFIFPTVMEPLNSLVGLNSSAQSFKFWFYSPFSRVWQFTVGGLCYLVLRGFATSKREISFKTNLIILFIFMITLYSEIELSSMVGSILASFITCVAIIFGSLNVLPRPVFLFLKWIGDRSYSIYLFHMPLLYVAKYAAVTSWGKGENRIFPTILAVIATFVLGSVSYRGIENRFRDQRFIDGATTKAMFRALMATLLLPLIIFMVINESASGKYWGLNIKYSQAPTSLGDMSDCEENLNLSQIICAGEKNSTQKTILLMGDSHAEHLRFALSEAAKNANWNSVFIPVKVESMNTEKRLVFKEWLRINKPDLIIISQFWNEDTLLDQALENLVDFKKLIPNILLLENNPIWPDSARFRLEGYLVAPQDFLPKTFPSSQMGLKEKKISDDMAKLAKDNGIDTMNFEQLFCSNSICTRYSEDGWLYNDYNHLSRAGAKLTIPMFQNYLKEFLYKNRN